MSVTRFGVSLEEEVLETLDNFVKENKYPNRSQAIRALIERNLVEKKWQCNNIVAGAIITVYDHHKNDVHSKSNDIQHEYYDVILSSQHYHLGHDSCLEIIAVKGQAQRLTELSEKIIALKGIKHGKLVMSKAD